MSMNSISMRDGMDAAKAATHDITYWLRAMEQTYDILNVEDLAYYQVKDIDIIWMDQSGKHHTIEIKGDRWEKTGNMFFETVSNEEKGTPGCFMYTEAEFLFYYFVNTKTLFVLPMATVRPWFIKNMEDFKERRTTTPYPGGHYTTVGRLVPIHWLCNGVPGVRRHQL